VVRGYQRICGFLRNLVLLASPHRARTTPYPPKASLQNYAEVKSALAGTRYAWMIGS